MLDAAARSGRSAAVPWHSRTEQVVLASTLLAAGGSYRPYLLGAGVVALATGVFVLLVAPETPTATSS